MTRICVLAPQTEYTLSGCYGHSCGELAPRALLAVAVALSETGVERLALSRSTSAILLVDGIHIRRSKAGFACISRRG
ncbi:MAG: hypothetical protein ACI4AE_03330 [Candidatus Cryptobacteroides sp.]